MHFRGFRPEMIFRSQNSMQSSKIHDLLSLTKNEQPWQEWRKYALDPKYTLAEQDSFSPGSRQKNTSSPSHVTYVSPDLGSPSPFRDRNLFDHQSIQTTSPAHRSRRFDFNGAELRKSASNAIDLNEFNEKSFDHFQDLVIAQENEQLRAEIDRLRSNLISGLQREEELKTYLEDCNQVGSK
jgi:hypothetical protein